MGRNRINLHWPDVDTFNNNYHTQRIEPRLHLLLDVRNYNPISSIGHALRLVRLVLYEPIAITFLLLATFGEGCRVLHSELFLNEQISFELWAM